MIIELIRDIKVQYGISEFDTLTEGSHYKAVKHDQWYYRVKHEKVIHYIHKSDCIEVKETPEIELDPSKDPNAVMKKASETISNAFTEKKQNKDPNKYAYTPKTYENGTMDHYLLMESLPKQPSSPIDHAIKKLTFAGTRGVKDEVQDLEEALQSINKRINYLTRARDGEWAK